MRDLLLLDSLLLALDTFKQVMERIRELLHTLILQLLGNLSIGNTHLLKGIEFRVGLWNVVIEAAAHLAMVAEVINGFQWHRIYRIRADKFLRIEDIAVGRILGAGAGPERPLHARSVLLEFLETR